MPQFGLALNFYQGMVMSRALKLLPLMLLLASAGGMLWALAAHKKGDPPLALRQVPFGTFLGIAAWAAVPLWPLLSGR